MGSWQHAGRMLRGLRENRGWEVPKLAAELKAKATAIGQAVPDRQSLVRMIYEWEAGTHRPRAYYVLFVLVYATEEELVARTIRRGSELSRLMAALKAMGVPVNRRQFLLGRIDPDEQHVVGAWSVGARLPLIDHPDEALTVGHRLSDGCGLRL